MKPFSALTQALACAGVLFSAQAYAAGEVNIYTTREPKLIQPILENFTKETGIKANTVFVKDGLIERVKSEGERSPADLLMMVDYGNLIDLVNAGVTQPVQSDTLESAIPASLRDPGHQWYALSTRARVLYAAKDLNLDKFTYEELADPKWKGKVCIRSGQHPYNTSLFAAVIAHDGAEKAQAWLEGVKVNLGRKAAGGDRDVAKDILGGICDIGIANSYYVGQMLNAAPDSDQRKWGEAIKVILPTFANSKDGGTHVNVSGAAVAKYSTNKDNAVKLLEYLASEKAQGLYASANYEYPVRAGIKPDATVASFGALKADTLPLADIAKYRKQASELVDKVGFDQ
ncbi:iron ABC transporter substrate-binding protein [Advenella kashmirensis W13003]|uniref:Iron ABC transporter substrate-binding protein n=1 Tax=Advenella kashmirensis W13003 TaxID=1424334 RepID=V8QRE2_9BURK|nr:Fe(3+) ABC transporter substrate-binding protein [Advenella kashmirensis]ETF01895.1 iron ABC transporter substrate-binding protein [Advenella kashmirensis W13003]